MHLFLPALLIGIGAILTGILILIYRGTVARANARANRQLFDRYGENVAKSSTPGQVAAVGVVFIVIGLIAILSEFRPV